MTFRRGVFLVLALAALAAAAAAVVVVRPWASPEPEPPPVAARPRPTPPPPIDAAQIASGRLSMDRMPEEIGAALESQTEEIVKNAEALESKQARVTGTCAPGSAIRVIAQDGSVSCQRFPRGVASVSAVAGVPLLPATVTSAGSVPGGVGRYQTAGEDDFLAVPIALPDGAVVTSFSFVFYDAAEGVDGAAYLYRSDDRPMAMVQTSGAANQVRSDSTDQIQLRRIDAAHYAYFVYFQTSAQAGANLLPISASVSYRLP